MPYTVFSSNEPLMILFRSEKIDRDGPKLYFRVTWSILGFIPVYTNRRIIP